MKKNNRFRVAIVQMASNSDKMNNIQEALRLVKSAINRRASFIVLPETFNYRGRNLSAETAECLPGPSLQPLIDLARMHKVWILAGSIFEKAPAGKKAYNSSVLIGSDGKIKTIYRKIHLFNVVFGSTKILESKICRAGKEPAMASVAGIKTGLGICYDLRFPELFSYYSNHGAKMICIPSSFTAKTGKDHWEPLLRARAIENQCFVLAANQYAEGIYGAPTYGNSMIIDPWGNILARGSSNKTELIFADLNFESLDRIRRQLPVLKSRSKRIWRG